MKVLYQLLFDFHIMLVPIMLAVDAAYLINSNWNWHIDICNIKVNKSEYGKELAKNVEQNEQHEGKHHAFLKKENHSIIS